MKASELRIGNFVNLMLNHEDFEMIRVDVTDLINIPHGGVYEPIPITEEWLKRFGFEKLDDKRGLYVNNKINLFIYFDGVRVSVDFWIGNEKRYVHELQNFVYCLSGEEL